MFMINYKELSWWYWFVTACLLTAGIAGYPMGFHLAIGLKVLQLIHFTTSEHSVTAFPVQVRFCYLMLLLNALPQPLLFIYRVPAVGTWAQLIFGTARLRAVYRCGWHAHRANAKKRRLSMKP